jgi:putative ATPase
MYEPICIYFVHQTSNTVHLHMEPLAERLRPRILDDYIGQQHLVGKNAVLRKAIENGIAPSMILWGPPGVGKTTLANIIANTTKRRFFQLSAINSGVKDIRETIDEAKRGGFFNSAGNPILFIDEIHRFSKSQQDSLLGAVEKGIVSLIGATTENPSFEVIPALLSRCQVYVLKELEKDDLIQLVNIALEKDAILKTKNIVVKEYDAMLQLSGGDGRKLLNILELVAEFAQNTEGGTSFEVDNEIVINIVQQNIVRYDKSGEQHYDIISAFIKSMRGSDPNAAVYYLARMLEGGEDPLFIARRMVILSSEDIGLANPNALLMATTTFQAVHQIGMPESRILLSQCAVYLATSAKSNSTYVAIDKALAKVRETGNLSIPLHLRNAPTRLMKDLNYGKGYQYAHAYEGNFAHQEFLPTEIAGEVFFEPAQNAAELRIRELLKQLWKEKYGY